MDLYKNFHWLGYLYDALQHVIQDPILSTMYVTIRVIFLADKNIQKVFR